MVPGDKVIEVVKKVIKDHEIERVNKRVDQLEQDQRELTQRFNNFQLEMSDKLTNILLGIADIKGELKNCVITDELKEAYNDKLQKEREKVSEEREKVTDEKHKGARQIWNDKKDLVIVVLTILTVLFGALGMNGIKIMVGGG